MEKITFGPVSQTWTLMVLPQLDQAPLYNMFNFSVMWSDPSQFPVTTATLPVWVCPSAPGPESRTDPSSIGGQNPAGYPAPIGGYGLGDYMALSPRRLLSEAPRLAIGRRATRVVIRRVTSAHEQLS